MCALVKTALALPVLGLVSVPLLLSAWVTISFALLTLCIRLGIVYIELVLALLVNFFTLPVSSSSFLTFAPTEPPTPIVSRRNSAHGLISRKSNDSLLTLGLNTIHDEASKRKQKTYARSMAEAHNLPTTPFIDGSRDFEGVGGWRSYSDSKRRGSHPNEKPLSSTSSSAQSMTGKDDDIDDDERAWLSLNHRLELPSQVVTLGSTAGSRVHSPVLSPRSLNNFHAFMPSRFHQDPERHHHRSHTTSSLTTSHRRTGDGLSLTLLTRQDRSQDPGHSVSPSASRVAPFMTPQPYSHFQTRLLSRQPTSGHANGYSSRDGPSGSTDSILGGGGYFAIPRPGSWYMGSPSASGYTTPGTGLSSEDRDASLHSTRLMAHYPTSVRHRRRSISGPHSRVETGGWKRI